MAKRAVVEDPEVIRLRIGASVHRFQIGADVFKSIVKWVSICVCVWIIMRGLVDLGGMEKGALGALAGVVKALKLNDWILYIATGGSFAAWRAERSGKKRAIAQLGELRRKQEAHDAYAGSSGLDQFGNTPKS